MRRWVGCCATNHNAPTCADAGIEDPEEMCANCAAGLTSPPIEPDPVDD